MKKKLEVLVYLIVAAIILFASIYYIEDSKKEAIIPDESGNGQEAIVEYERFITPLEYLENEYKNLTDVEKEQVVYFESVMDYDWFKNYQETFDTNFDEKFLIKDSIGNTINLSNVKEDKVIILRNKDSRRLNEYYEDYLYLMDSADTVGAYKVYIVNYSNDSDAEFLETYKNSYVIESSTKEIKEDIVLFVDSENKVVSAADVTKVNLISDFAMYSFNGRFTPKKAFEVFDYVYNNNPEILKEFNAND